MSRAAWQAIDTASRAPAGAAEVTAVTVAVGDRHHHPAVLERDGRDGVLVGDARRAMPRAALGGGDGLPSARAVRCGLPGQAGVRCGHLGHRRLDMICGFDSAAVPSCGSDTIFCSASRTSRWCSHAVAVTRPLRQWRTPLPDGAGLSRLSAARSGGPGRAAARAARPGTGLGLGVDPVPGRHLHGAGSVTPPHHHHHSHHPPHRH
jgi:hypothetical protein